MLPSGGDPSPGRTAVFAAKDTFQGSCDHDLGVRRGLGESTDRLALHGFDRSPGLARVVADEKPAVGMIDHPGADQQYLGSDSSTTMCPVTQIVRFGQLGKPLQLAPPSSD